MWLGPAATMQDTLSPKGIVNKSLQPFTSKHTIENYFKMRIPVLGCCALEICSFVAQLLLSWGIQTTKNRHEIKIISL
jgi:hypothetical protein